MADGIWRRIWRWENLRRHPGGAPDSRGSHKGRGGGQRVSVREGDVRSERGRATGQGTQVASRKMPRASGSHAARTAFWTSDLETLREQTCAASGRKSAVNRHSGHRTLVRPATRTEPAGDQAGAQADARSRRPTPRPGAGRGPDLQRSPRTASGKGGKHGLLNSTLIVDA